LLLVSSQWEEGIRRELENNQQVGNKVGLVQSGEGFFLFVSGMLTELRVLRRKQSFFLIWQSCNQPKY
jgi:hypothetical protein